MMTGLLIMLALLFAIQLFGARISATVQNYTQDAFAKDISAGNVEGVVIIPNKETPTGVARVELKGGETKVLYATDIRDVEKMVRDSGLDPAVQDVPRDSWFVTSLLPMLLVTAVCMIFFYMMNMQQMGGGTNAKMMNFGKSRAFRRKRKTSRKSSIFLKIRRNIPSSERAFPRESFLRVPPEPVKRSLPRRLREKQASRFSPSPVMILLKCLSASEHPA